LKKFKTVIRSSESQSGFYYASVIHRKGFYFVVKPNTPTYRRFIVATRFQNESDSYGQIVLVSVGLNNLKRLDNVCLIGASSYLCILTRGGANSTKNSTNNTNRQDYLKPARQPGKTK